MTVPLLITLVAAAAVLVLTVVVLLIIERLAGLTYRRREAGGSRRLSMQVGRLVTISIESHSPPVQPRPLAHLPPKGKEAS